MPQLHYTAATAWPSAPFLKREIGMRLWNGLRRRFPIVSACVLMPDHVHLIVDYDRKALLDAMRAEKSALARRHPEIRWQPTPPPRDIPDLHHLKRQIRYVHLNPCRAGLATDPLEWEWSTHRDAIGAAAPAWFDRKTARKALGCGEAVFARAFHAYVSGDPTVRPEGTSLPSLISTQDLAAPLDSIEWAILQATRANAKSATSRRLKLLLAERLGARRSRLAVWVSLSDRRIRGILASSASVEENAALHAATLLLSARSRFEISEKRKF